MVSHSTGLGGGEVRVRKRTAPTLDYRENLVGMKATGNENVRRKRKGIVEAVVQGEGESEVETVRVILFVRF